MRKQIGKYVYCLKEDGNIDVLFNEGSDEHLIMVFIKRVAQIYSQGEVTNPDYIEIQTNAILIFTGQITME